MIRKPFWLFAVAFGFCTLLGMGASRAGAQRAAAASAPRTSMPAHPAPGRVATSARSGARVSASSPARRSRVSSAGFPSNGGSSSFFNSTPGFDFGTSSIWNQDLWTKAAIDPATQWRLFEAQKFLHNRGFGGSGFYLLDGGAYYPIPDDSAGSDQNAQQLPQQQEPIEIVQRDNSQRDETASNAALAESASLPDAGQFVLVLRNGTQLQALAFTRANGRIIYVTPEGSRRTIAASDLDSDSTNRVNQERGTPLSLPL